MALMPCPECSNEISKNARSCPRCGLAMRSGSTWVYFATGGGLLIGVVGLVLFIRANAKPTFISAKDAAAICYADNEDTTCTITNVRSYAVTTCLRGRITPNKAAGVNLFSLTLWSGKVEPLETRTVRAPWSGGRPKDLCNAKIGTTEILDWDQCTFATEDVTP